MEGVGQGPTVRALGGYMDIVRDDYEERRHIFDFCRWINQKLSSLEQDSDFRSIYFERTGALWKKFLEEAIPLSRLGLYLYGEWLEVFVRCYADNSNYDAEIEISNPAETRRISVEITTTEDNESSMRRQALSRKGFVHFNGSVTRNGPEIVSTGSFVEVDEESDRIIQLALQRLVQS
jgi:hypothetical protein